MNKQQPKQQQPKGKKKTYPGITVKLLGTFSEITKAVGVPGTGDAVFRDAFGNFIS